MTRIYEVIVRAELMDVAFRRQSLGRCRELHFIGAVAVIADHPDALSAVLGIGSDGAVRSHMMAAIRHLLKINPPQDHISYIDHSLALADKLATSKEIKMRIKSWQSDWLRA
jgi:hypothetical protein